MAIEITSPIAVMPFGKHKGKVFWTLGVHYFNWLANSDASARTKKTIEDAMLMHSNKGCYAVLRKARDSKFHIELKGLYSTQPVADAHVESDSRYIDFVYHVVEPDVGVYCAPK